MNLVRIVAAATAGTLVVGSPPVLASSPAPAPALQTLALVPSTGASAAGRSASVPGADRTGAARGGMAVGPRSTRPFSLLGVTWTDARAAVSGTIEVRTRSSADGTWSAWRALESDEPDAADPGAEPAGQRGSTDPLWVGPSNGVEARVASAAGLPTGLRLDLINPDVPANPAPASAPAPSARTEAATGVVPPLAVPPYISRAGWRADESIVQHAPEYTDDVQVFFVHHTATTNNYSCGQSASIVRGIEMYHVKSRGWNDIGYNFLVDKCGNLFEGRAGGVTRPVLGAHTLGFNSNASAIAVIGDYDAVGVSPAVRTIIAQVASYKLGAYGHSATGTVVLTSNGSDRYPAGRRVSLNRISGHRDTGRTECPGTTLYGQLPAIRTLAAAAPALSLAAVPGALGYDGHYFTTGSIRPTWNLASPSRLIDRFEVLVDGVVTGYLRGGFRYRAVSLTPGAHTVTVRAVALNRRVSTVSFPIVADATAPVFGTAPWLSLRSGSVAGSVPIQVNWAVSDAGGLAALGLTSPVPYHLGVARTAWRTTIAPGRATTWTVRAADRAGNETRRAVTGTVTPVPETAATRAGSWTELRRPEFLGGAAAVTRTAGATLSWTFTGSAAQLVTSTGRGYGRLDVSVDGGAPVTVDPHSAATVDRVAVWAPNWHRTGSHTLTVRVVGAAGNAYARIDGLMVLR